ncbi:MAG: antitoxin, partial [Hyphomicrobiales bacterium]
MAERLKAEQRKRDESKRDEQKPQDFKAPREELKAPREELKASPKEESKPLDFAPERERETPPSPSPKHLTRTRRPAGPPPQRRLAPPANDDVPSIGGLIFALQQRPSRTPFLVALAASVAWFIIGGLFAFGIVSDQISSGSFMSASVLWALAAILLPIVLFWFLALLVWRAQELRLMASAMTEVAVRLAEPDRLAEQSVASVGQTIRRQVAAMNDAISRAIGRASEL